VAIIIQAEGAILERVLDTVHSISSEGSWMGCSSKPLAVERRWRSSFQI
jgi:hypothetical protein